MHSAALFTIWAISDDIPLFTAIETINNIRKYITPYNAPHISLLRFILLASKRPPHRAERPYVTYIPTDIMKP